MALMTDGGALTMAPSDARSAVEITYTVTPMRKALAENEPPPPAEGERLLDGGLSGLAASTRSEFRLRVDGNSLVLTGVFPK